MKLGAGVGKPDAAAAPSPHGRGSPGAGVWFVAGLLLLAAGLFSVSAAPGPPVVPVAFPQSRSVTGYLELTGNAASINTVKLIARVEGYLEKLHFTDGAMVRKGQRLFTIQQDQYRAQLQQAKAQVYVQKAALEHARIEAARFGALVKKGASTQVELDHWRYMLRQAEGKLWAARAQVAIAELTMGYTEVRAPFDGLLGRHLVDPFNTIGGPGQQAAVVELMQLDPIYVVANLSEQEVFQLRADFGQRRRSPAELAKMPVDVALNGRKSFSYRGSLDYVAPHIDPRTGTLLIRGLLPNPDAALLPGMFVRMRLPRRPKAEPALLVPNRALSEDQGGRYLLVVNQNDVVEQRYVQLGELYGSMRVITSGLGPADRVVVGELWRASPGTKVSPKLVSGEAPAHSGTGDGPGAGERGP
jgi:RND family efflux transporter MFP subunit